MGWTGYKLGQGWSLFHRHGLEGVFISNNKEGEELIEIPIPKEILLQLAAEQVRTAKISQLEQMTDIQVLGLYQKMTG